MSRSSNHALSEQHHRQGSTTELHLEYKALKRLKIQKIILLDDQERIVDFLSCKLGIVVGYL